MKKNEKLKNGNQFMVGNKTYRVVDDELFEVKLVRVCEGDPCPYPIYPIYPIYPWRQDIEIISETTTGNEITLNQ